MRLLRFWFGFTEPIGRRAYFRHGSALMLAKYALDAALIWRYAGRVWTPLDYLNPLWSARTELLQGAPSWLAPALVVLALPFLWIGVSMTMRRAVDAGRSPWLALLFFVPVVNYALMVVLSLLPSASRVRWRVEGPSGVGDERLKSAMLGVAASLGITLPAPPWPCRLRWPWPGRAPSSDASWRNGPSGPALARDSRCSSRRSSLGWSPAWRRRLGKS